MSTTQPCLNCESIFTSKTKNARFCGKSCAATYQHKNTSPKPKSIDCKRCGISVVLTRNQKGKLKTRNYCNICVKLVSHERKGNNITPWNLRTKAEVFNGSGNWQSARTAIRRHAVQVFLDSKKPKSCTICEYNKHIEICHIKSVSSFDGDITLAEITL